MNSNMSDDMIDQNVARSLTLRYVIALILVASLSTAAWLSLHLVISEQKSTAAIVNVSGRQRMLSQRTALFANLLANSPATERPAIRDKLKDAINLMERSHEGLTHGDASMGLPETLSPAVRAMYYGTPDALDHQVVSYIAAIQAWLMLEDNELTLDKPLLNEITRTASTTLVSALDKMVRQYQLEGEASVSQLQKAETIFWLSTLLLLILEAILIFHPFVRHVRIIFGKLQSVTDELRVHHDQLEETVRERTAELENRSRALAESEEKFRLIGTNAKDGIIIIGKDGIIVYWNPAAEALFGYSANESIGQNLHDLITPERYRETAHKGFERFQQFGVGSLVGQTFDISALHKNGEEFPIALSISAFMYKNHWHALGTIRDITERKQMEEQVRQLAFYDALTSLPNRRLFNDRLKQSMAASRRNNTYGAVLFLDLDNFKPLNDTHGHNAGDLLLIEAAGRLKQCAREMDTVARFGGDEFVMILNDLGAHKTPTAAQASLVAEKIRINLSAPYLLEVKQEEQPDRFIEHHCTASIGIALFINHDDKPNEVMKQADEAMYHAKAAGRNQIRLYEPKV